MNDQHQLQLSEAEKRVLRKQYEKLKDDEFDAFLSAAERYRLNPMTNQIYAQVHNPGDESKRKVTYCTGIDGYRLIADRTGQLAGNDDPVFEKEPKLEGDGEDVKATVTVYKIVDGEARPFTASARWRQYCPSPPFDFMWKKMPHLMLGKCAEALALRKAFPAELSGIYTQEEMDQTKEQDGRGSFDPDKANGSPQRKTPTNGNGELTMLKQAISASVRKHCNLNANQAKPVCERVFTTLAKNPDNVDDCKAVQEWLNGHVDGDMMLEIEKKQYGHDLKAWIPKAKKQQMFAVFDAVGVPTEEQDEPTIEQYRLASQFCRENKGKDFEEAVAAAVGARKEGGR